MDNHSEIHGLAKASKPNPDLMHYYKSHRIVNLPPYTYIYCPFDNITVANQTDPCPPYPFSIKTSRILHIGNTSLTFDASKHDLTNTTTDTQSLFNPVIERDHLNTLERLEYLEKQNKEIEDSLLNMRFQYNAFVAKGASGGLFVLLIIGYVIHRLLNKNPVVQALEMQTALHVADSTSRASLKSEPSSSVFIVNNVPPSAPYEVMQKSSFYPRMPTPYPRESSTGEVGVDCDGLASHEPSSRQVKFANR